MPLVRIYPLEGLKSFIELKDAKIYHFSKEKIEEIEYDDIESVIFTKHFLNNKGNFVDRL